MPPKRARSCASQTLRSLNEKVTKQYLKFGHLEHTTDRGQMVTLHKERIILSASRREELLYHPKRFLNSLAKFPPEQVHSIVMWTKTPHLLLKNQELMKKLSEYDQIIMHVTITGLGASFLEPNIPHSQEIIDLLPKLIDFVKSPKRINVRFDPILNLIHKDGRVLSNFSLFPDIAEQCKEQEVREFTISWITAYKKVERRLSALGFTKFEADDTLKTKQAKQLHKWANMLNVNIKGCCTQPFFPTYGCINGKLLSELHPRKENCTLEKPLGQRRLCHCTKSMDIGWYYSCHNGCTYCYGHPKFDYKKSLDLKERQGINGILTN